MSSINALILKVKKALLAKGEVVFIDQKQFPSKEGDFIITKYIIHRGNGNERDKNNDIIDICYSKGDLLKVLVKILKEGDEYGKNTT